MAQLSRKDVHLFFDYRRNNMLNKSALSSTYPQMRPFFVVCLCNTIVLFSGSIVRDLGLHQGYSSSAVYLKVMK